MAISTLPTCKSCCEVCSTALTPSGNVHDGSGPSQPSPYALQNLLPVGTICINVLNNATSTICAHNHTDDGWHPFQGFLFLGWLTRATDDVLCGELDFLSQNFFLKATYRAYNEQTGKLRIRKDAILGPARRYLRKLLPLVSRSKATWDGSNAEGAEPFMAYEEDNRTLSELYSELHSPAPTPPSRESDIARRLLDFEDDLGGLGMRSTLYHYQRRTIAAMVERERSAADINDPLFVLLKTITGEEFYLQPGTLQTLRDCPKVAPPRGGLLCEELGTGKTVMVLGLILATVNQLPTPEPSIMDDRPVLTPLAFRHFPSDAFHTARQRLFRGSVLPNCFQASRVPSLVEILLHKMRTHPDTTIPNTMTGNGARLLSKKMYLTEALEGLPLSKMLQSNPPFYHYYSGEPTIHYRTNRKPTAPGPRVVYLSSATLIVVPANLVSQWDREIQKHCEHPLRVFILRTGTRIPTVQSLASDYDIILMTYNRFTAEDSKKSVNKLHTLKSCECFEYPDYRIPDCKCKNSTGVSPLLQIRWKRVVIDEGHVSASLATTLTPFTKLLSVERRWIVTGTPTTNLLGLSLGGRSADAEEASDGDVEMEAPPSVDDLNGQGHIKDTLSIEIIPNTSQQDAHKRRRIWTKYDREDLLKLGNMITHFIAVPHFIADPKLLVTHVTDPLLDPTGPRPGSIQVLTQVMEMVMIRHRIEDVEAEVLLPPIKHESIMLDLYPFAIKSYNAMQATIAINAVDSQRTDQDYMFHPRNADLLQVAVKVMSQIMFWSVTDEMFNADQLLQDELKHFTTAVERETSPADIKLMKDAFRHLHIAAEDPLWRAMQMHEDVPYRVHDMDPVVFEGWTRIPRGEDVDAHLTEFIHPDRLLKLRHLVNTRPLTTIPDLVEQGHLVDEQDIKLRKLYDESLRRKKSERRNKSHRQQDPNTSAKAATAAKKASAAETLKEVQNELNTSLARAENEAEEHLSFLPSQPIQSQCNQASSGLVMHSPVITTRVGTSASSKLNYIINEVLQYSPTEKFLIFSDSELSLAHIAEALELVGVKYLRFTTQITPQFREQLVLTFETSETFRVFLMELKHGARGLNLISASRVIFCEPVWQADVESQAIKRAHRIGQTKSIHVKTLAIRGTAEESMVARREALRSNQGRLPKLTEEAGMRHFIANPKFIEKPPTNLPTINVPLITPPAEDTSGLSTSPRKHQLVQPSQDPKASDAPHRHVSFQGDIVLRASSSDTSPPKKKARVVRFA